MSTGRARRLEHPLPSARTPLLTPSAGTRLARPADMMPGMPADKNRLFYGDNLAVLRQHVADESVDLVYLDPPFNSNRLPN